MSNIKESLINLLMQYGPGVLGAVVILIAGFWLIRVISRITERFLKRSSIDSTLRSFIHRALGITLKILLIVTAASTLGIPMTTFIALLSAIGLAVGLALRDNLANLAGGIIILAFRPFKLGDYIEAQSTEGTVREIRLAHTVLNTADNRQVLIPNGQLANTKIINYSAEKERRLDLTFKVSYRDDIRKVREILLATISLHPLILKNPEPFVRIGEYGEYAVLVFMRVWCRNEYYWNIRFDLLEQVKVSFDREGIVIPYQQYNVHLLGKPNDTDGNKID